MFQRFVPLIERGDVEGPFARREHVVDFRLRLIILAILAMCETSELIHRTKDRDDHQTEPHDGFSAESALTTLGKMATLPVDTSQICIAHVIANIAAFVSWDMKRDGRASWFYLQQAISFVQLLGMDSAEYYGDLPYERNVASDLKLFYTM